MELSKAHKLLLKAAFVKDDSAVEAWRNWHPLVDWEGDPDPATYRLLAQLQRNIKHRTGIHHLLNKFAGVARKNWFKNQQLFGEYEPLIEALIQADISPVIDPVTAITLMAPDTPFDRAKPIALSVSPPRLFQAIQIAQRANWSMLQEIGPRTLRGYLAWHKKIDLKNNQGFFVRIDATQSKGNQQAESLASSMMSKSELKIWPLPHRIQIVAEDFFDGREIDSIDELDYFHWLTNMALLLNTSNDALELNQLTPHITEDQMPLFRTGMAYLEELFPERVMGSPNAILKSVDFCDHKSTESFSNRYADRFRRVWEGYKHNLPEEIGFAERLSSFPGYLMARWGLRSYKQLPAKINKSLRHRFSA